MEIHRSSQPDLKVLSLLDSKLENDVVKKATDSLIVTESAI